MIIMIFNNSRKKSFRKTKRIITQILVPISNRVSVGDIPKRILLELIKNLKITANRGTNVKIFIEAKSGFHGFKCIEIGKRSNSLEDFTNSLSTIEEDLIYYNLIPKVP